MELSDIWDIKAAALTQEELAHDINCGGNDPKCETCYGDFALKSKWDSVAESENHGTCDSCGRPNKVRNYPKSADSYCEGCFQDSETADWQEDMDRMQREEKAFQRGDRGTETSLPFPS